MQVASDGRQPELPAAQLRQALEQVSEGVYITDLDRRILYWNNGAARISGFGPEEVMGTRCYDNVLMHVDEAGTSLCTTACPLAKAMSDGDSQQALLYLHHKGGHRVPVVVRTAALRNDAGAVVAGVETFTESGSVAALRERMATLEAESVADPLTGIPNRRHLVRVIDEHLASLQRHRRPFGLLFADVDHFKRVNDTYGHDVGDGVLRMVAATIAGSTRASDAVGRWGGEEFILLAAEVSHETLLTAAQRVLNLVEQSWLMVGEARVSVTVSLGAALAREGDSPSSLVARADRLMYLSKERGRNTISMESDLPAAQ